MKAKKLLTLGLGLTIALGVTACSPKEQPKDQTTTEPPMETPNDNTVVDNNDYVQQYSRFYGDYMTGLNNYQMYLTPERATEYYKTEAYPGNEKYLAEVKTAYKDTRDKMQSFVDSLKNDVKTEDAELKKMNDNLIAEGEQSIKNIDARLKKLEELPADAINKSQDEFIKIVGDTTVVKDEVKTDFKKMLEDMNKALGIDMNNNNTNK
ncbi:MAG: hypothetical protein ACRDD7_07720 [Peptostreptococcaceae bacterium]